MLASQAEVRFREGMQLLGRGHARDALPFFSSAIEIQKKLYDHEEQARYLSFQGLCLGITNGSKREALKKCRQAVQLEDFNADMWWNLGRVALHAGKRREAYRALRRGLELDPDHRGLRKDLVRMGRRRPKVFSFLSRRHPLNVMFGKMR